MGKETAGLQITRGGPILMVQVENEYGCFGSDKVYMDAIRHMIRDAGFDVMLYTSDGSGKCNLAGGTLDDVLSVINFGDTAQSGARVRQFRRVPAERAAHVRRILGGLVRSLGREAPHYGAGA